jgi:hypothetical protein
MATMVHSVTYQASDFVEQCMAAELSFELIDSATAEEMLECNTSNYRNLTDSTVLRYMKDLEAGLWTHTTATVSFTASGVLVDGQHRLHAIARSGKSVWMFVLRNLPEEFANDPNQDKGKMRSVSVFINKLGVKNATTASSAIRILYRLAVGASASRNGSSSLTDSQVLRCVEFMPQMFFDWVNTVSASSTVKKAFTPSVNAVFFYLAASHNTEAAQSFFDVFSRRVDESSSHPANTLREQVIGSRKLTDNDKFLNLAFAAFSGALRGEHRKMIRRFGDLQLPTGSKKALDYLLEILNTK